MMPYIKTLTIGGNMKNTEITRRKFLRNSAQGAALAALLPTMLSCQKKPGKKPNIVFIYVDDLGYGDLGCYGREDIITPNIDKLASEGVKFTDFYVTASACTPSRGSLLTGRYPQRNGMYDMIRNNVVDYGYKFDEATYAVSPEMTLGMDLREITIGQQLQKAGYTTGVVGKWDGGRAKRYLPLQRGFDFFYGFSNTGIDYYTHERYGVPSMFRGNELVKEEGYATDLFRREAVNFIRENKDKPFFLYVPFNSPHNSSNIGGPHQQAPDKYIRMYGVEPPSERKIRYKANVTCMDDAVGEILSTLKELGLEENTLVMFSSDNGGSGSQARNDPLRGGKSQMYEGGIRVPFIAKFPGLIPAGSESREFSSTLDMFPTFCSIATIKTPKNVIMDGYNILPILEGKGKSEQKEMFFEYRYEKAARVGNWKWVESPEYEGGLFDLSNDIGEKNDLSEEKPEILKMVKERWLNWKKEMDNAEPRGPFRNF